MKLLSLYSWLIGNMNDFITPFRHSEPLYAKARAFWMHLDKLSVVAVAIVVVVSLLMTWYYYGPYNNRPGRNYQPGKWAGILLANATMVFCLTLALLYIAVSPQLVGAFMLEVEIAFANAMYAIIIYFIASFVVCNSGIKTNAYRFMKIR